MLLFEYGRKRMGQRGMTVAAAPQRERRLHDDGDEHYCLSTKSLNRMFSYCCAFVIFGVYTHYLK